MTNETDYLYPVLYSPSALDTLAIIMTDMDCHGSEAHMRLWKLEITQDDQFACSYVKEPSEGFWRMYNSFDEANERMNELHPVTLDGRNMSAADRIEAKEIMRQMINAFNIWYNRFADEEERNEQQRDIYAFCCKRDEISPDMENVDISVGGIYVNAKKGDNGYTLEAEDTPVETYPASDMLDALSFLPEYLSIPEVILPENIRMKPKNGK